MSRLGRFEWVFQQFETALREGLSARREVRRKRRALGNSEPDGESTPVETEMPRTSLSNSASAQDVYNRLVYVPWPNGEVAVELDPSQRAELATKLLRHLRATSGGDLLHSDDSDMDLADRPVDDDDW